MTAFDGSFLWQCLGLKTLRTGSFYLKCFIEVLREEERMKMIFELSPPQTNPVVVMNNKKLHRNKLEQEEILQETTARTFFLFMSIALKVYLDWIKIHTCLQSRWVYIKLKVGWGLYSDQCSGLTSGDSNLTSHSSVSDCLWLTWETHFIAAV